MFKALSKTRSANFYANQVKILLLIVVAVIFWNSDSARTFTADTLNNAAEIVRPETNKFTIQF